MTMSSIFSRRWLPFYRAGDDTVFNIFKVVARHGEPADVICAKEPFLMTQAGDVSYNEVTFL